MHGRAPQPITDVPTLELRLDALQELLESPHLALEAAALLETLPPNLDKARREGRGWPGAGGRQRGKGQAGWWRCVAWTGAWAG
jgi:hypothetical protein